MRNENDIIIPLIISAICMFMSGAIFGVLVGQAGGKKDGIVYCMENPAGCKVQYDYLKLDK